MTCEVEAENMDRWEIESGKKKDDDPHHKKALREASLHVSSREEDDDPNLKKGARRRWKGS